MIEGGCQIARTEHANARLADRALANTRDNKVAAPRYIAFEQHASTSTIVEGRQQISPELARSTMTNLRYDGQRPAYQHHVALLSDAMQRGQWTPGTQIAFGRLPDGTMHLVNGQHRLLALSDSGTTQEFQVLIVDVADEPALSALYNHFDVVARQRSLSEVLNATGIAKKLGLTKSMAKATYESVAILENGLRRPNYQVDPVGARSKDVRFELARQWWAFAIEYEQLIKPASVTLKTKLVGPGVVTVALATLRYQNEKATEFWRGLAENDGLRKGDARRTLIQALYDRNFAKGNQDGRIILPANAWNNWFQGKDALILKIFQGAEPRLLGTPYGRRKMETAS